MSRLFDSSSERRLLVGAFLFSRDESTTAMASFSRIRGPGQWTVGSVVTPVEFDAFDDMRPKVPNFAEGSMHSPTSPIIVGGEGMRVEKPPVEATDVVNKAALDTKVSIGSAVFGAAVNQEIATGGNKVVLASYLPGAGISLEDTTDVQLYNGRWLVTLSTRLTRPTTEARAPMDFQLYRGGSVVGEFTGDRFSNDPAHAASVSGSTVVEVTDATTQRISLRNYMGGAGTTMRIATSRTRFCFVFLGEVGIA